MAQGKDIDWKQIGFVGGAAIFGIAAGVFLLAPMYQKMKSKKQAALLAAKKTEAPKKKA